MTKSFDWTDERIERLTLLHSKGESGSFIARDLGTTRNSVIGKLHRMALKAVPKKPSIKVEKLVQPLKVKTSKHTFHAGNLANKKQARLRDPAVIHPKPAHRSTEYDLNSYRIPLMELGKRECRFAVNDAAVGEKHLFCGEVTADGQSYCAHHRAIVYAPLRQSITAAKNAAFILRKAA